MNGREILAWNVRTLRTAKGLSQERLAVDASVDRTWVSQLERGNGNTSIDVLDRLAASLGVPLAALLVEPDPKAPKPEPLRSGRKS